ncbi:MAG: hypothetical protein ABW068_11655 [Candidatus Thiodiazotropha sp.]
MLNRHLLILLALIAVGPATLPAASLTAEVASLRAQAQDQHRIPVIVRFDSALPISDLRSLASRSEVYQSGPASPDIRKKRFRREVFTALKEQAQTSTSRISGLMRQNGVKTPLRTFWTINAVAASQGKRSEGW